MQKGNAGTAATEASTKVVLARVPFLVPLQSKQYKAADQA